MTDGTGSWHFRRMQPGEMNIDPIEAEFFSTEALGSLADALVREAIQNSLDARRPGEQVKVRMTFSRPEAALEGAHRDRYLGALHAHLEATGSGLASPPAASDPLDFLVVEDYGTRGLQGDPAQTEDAELESDGTRNDFYYFWRNIGRSRKGSSELGRWGLGKTVFPAASRINSFFALTVRADDGRRLLMGQSVLRIHKVAGRRCYPYGYFGRFAGEFPEPVEEPAALDRFCSDFGIARGEAPGLSVVLPYPEAELAPRAVVPSIVRHYFVPILAGDLVVEVRHDGRTEILDARSLPRLLAEGLQDEPALRPLIELARWGLGVAREAHVILTPPPEAAAPRWEEACIPAEALARLRESFNRAARIAVTVPVWVKPVAGAAVVSGFDVYVERDDGLAGGEEHFVREGITVAGVRGAVQKGVRAIVLVRERALSQLLGDSENPAHTEWQERSLKFRGRYRHGPYTLRYVKNAPREIVRLLTRPAEARDFELLRNVFALDLPEEEQPLPRKTPGKEPGGGGPDDGAERPETVGRDAFFQLQKLRGGFRLLGAGKRGAMSRYAAVWIAYETRRGNPFAQYQPPDFEVDRAPIEVRAERAEVIGRGGNRIVLRLAARDFRLSVLGFDAQRDLRVKIVPLDEEAAA